MDLKTPIKDAGRIYKMYASRLEKLGIHTLADFLFHIPHRYLDYSLVSRIAHVQSGEVVTIQGTVLEIKNSYTKSGKKIQKAKISDETGILEAVWFNQPFLIRVMKQGDKVSLSGKISDFSHKPVMESPDYEVITQNETIHTGRLVPMYPETHGVSSKWLRRQIYKLLGEYNHQLTEYLPDSITKTLEMISLPEALRYIHFPKSLKDAQQAKKRLSFDELFLLQLAALQRRTSWKNDTTSHALSIAKFKDKIEAFWNSLPFVLTNAQKKAVQDIFSDLSHKEPMNRLLEGDVGSGKTVVSAIAMYLAYLNGFQSVLMAPTEILAQQHFKTIENLLSTLGVKVGLTTISIKYKVSSIKYKKNKLPNTKYSILDTDILVGTHAVLSEKINFNKLGLVVIDEQQRFGVKQRAIIRKKGENPHLLTMTATPIPRTIALTMYGDLDLSYLDEMPKGRKEIKTWLVPPTKRESAYAWIEDQIIQTQSQAFIICPFIEESESMQTIKAAKKEYEYLVQNVFPNLKLGLLHGKLKAKEKEEVLQRFKEKEFHMLVATPVVEVGIDIANATIIVIEAADRFGLSQLHQLRGRVGRGEKQSYCLLFTESKSDQTLKRLKAMEHMHIGAQLAELDLKLRGPGDMYGIMQHGLAVLKVASFSDFTLIEQARMHAEKIFPNLSEHIALAEKLEEITIKNISPD